jgi:hypothetical protein
MVILVSKLEDLERFLDLAQKYNLQELTYEGVTIRRYPSRPQVGAVEFETPQHADALDRKREYYTLAFGGRTPSDKELSWLPEVG